MTEEYEVEFTEALFSMKGKKAATVSLETVRRFTEAVKRDQRDRKEIRALNELGIRFNRLEFTPLQCEQIVIDLYRYVAELTTQKAAGYVCIQDEAPAYLKEMSERNCEDLEALEDLTKMLRTSLMCVQANSEMIIRPAM